MTCGTTHAYHHGCRCDPCRIAKVATVESTEAEAATGIERGMDAGLQGHAEARGMGTGSTSAAGYDTSTPQGEIMSELNIREIAEKLAEDRTYAIAEYRSCQVQALAADWLRLTAPLALGGKFAEIEAREKAATKGPWSVDAYKTGTSTDKGDKYAWVSRGNGTPVFGTAGRALICDAEFTGHARTDIPALLQEVRRLTAAREADRQHQVDSDARIANQREEIKWYASEVATLQNRLNIYSSWREADRQNLEALKLDLEIANEGAQFYNRKAADLIVLREADRQEIERLKVAESFAWNTGHAKLIDLAAKQDADTAGLRDALGQAKNDFEAIAYDHGIKAEHQTAETLRETWQRTFDTAMDGRGKIEDAINESLAAVPPAPAEVSLADCKNADCPVGCPDSHCLDFDEAPATEAPERRSMKLDDYTLILRRDEDGDTILRVAELNGFTTHGIDVPEAISRARDLFELWKTDVSETGDSMPEPLPFGVKLQNFPAQPTGQTPADKVAWGGWSPGAVATPQVAAPAPEPVEIIADGVPTERILEIWELAYIKANPPVLGLGPEWAIKKLIDAVRRLRAVPPVAEHPDTACISASLQFAPQPLLLDGWPITREWMVAYREWWQKRLLGTKLREVVDAARAGEKP